MVTAAQRQTPSQDQQAALTGAREIHRPSIAQLKKNPKKGREIAISRTQNTRIDRIILQIKPESARV